MPSRPKRRVDRPAAPVQPESLPKPPDSFDDLDFRHDSFIQVWWDSLSPPERVEWLITASEPPEWEEIPFHLIDPDAFDEAGLLRGDKKPFMASGCIALVLVKDAKGGI